MSIPLRETEQRFNCAHAGFALTRTWSPLYDGEPAEGRFVVWRTLGFGGRPNPLLFSRTASFAARTAQAILGHDLQSTDTAQVAPGRLELYVDDPICSVKACRSRAMEAFDLVICWWLTLGVPLSWKKGVLSDGLTPHRWIGIDYVLGEEGAIMRLPPKFVAELSP